MGFKVPRRNALLRFEGTEYGGAEIKCRLDISFADFFEFEKLRWAGEDVEKVRDLIQRFAEDILIEWNLEDDDGKAITPSVDSLFNLPPAFVLLLMQEWLSAIGRVPGPLGATSNDGGTSEGESERTADPSPSLQL
jgi:hypothetical protein